MDKLIINKSTVDLFETALMHDSTYKATLRFLPNQAYGGIIKGKFYINHAMEKMHTSECIIEQYMEMADSIKKIYLNE